MANKIKQYRFYGPGSTRNQPVDVQASDFVSGAFVENVSALPIVQLGIQALPGTRFYLNEAPDAIVIGSTGIYELDLMNVTEISDIRFDAASIQLISQNENAGLIVDTIYVSQEDE